MFQYNFNTRNKTTLVQRLPSNIGEIRPLAPLAKYAPLEYDMHEVENIVKHIAKLPPSAYPAPAPAPPTPEPVVEEDPVEDAKKGKPTKGKKGAKVEEEVVQEPKPPPGPILSPYELHEKMYETSSKVQPMAPLGPRPSFSGPNRGRGIAASGGAAGAEVVEGGEGDMVAAAEGSTETETVDAPAVAADSTDKQGLAQSTEDSAALHDQQEHQEQEHQEQEQPEEFSGEDEQVENDTDSDDGQYSDSPEMARARAEAHAVPKRKEDMAMHGSVCWRWQWTCRKTSKWASFKSETSEEIERAYLLHQSEGRAHANLLINRGDGRKQVRS
jgi:hypothetical protein